MSRRSRILKRVESRRKFCPVTQQKRFKSRKVALDWAAEFNQRGSRLYPRPEVTDAYECALCEGWHLMYTPME